MTPDELPAIELSVEDVVVLFVAALDPNDLEKADRLADALLRRNDGTSDA